MVKSTVIDIATEQAKKSKMRSYHHGSVIISKTGKIIGKGFNRTDFPQKKNGKYSKHAEMVALNDAIEKHGPMALRGAEMVVVRILIDGMLSNSKPCHNCQTVLESCMDKYGLKAVYYSM